MEGCDQEAPMVECAIITLKEETIVLKKSSNPEPVLEEFIPLQNTSGEDAKLEIISKEKCGGDKKNWLSTTQLWNNPNPNPNLNTNQT
uniref:Uncharacterized protein n=1 Tax=Lactuca sativa TaxID=4236 RepID=A0A9R1XEE3_LACSA|nr:hypothetical protein LSAT_V11C400184940 [Lactuca sativa]